MKNIISGQLYRILILVSSISILAACGASDVLDLADNIGNGGGNVETFGSVTVSGNDTGTIGTSFEPTAERLSALTDDILFAAFADADVNIITQTGAGRILTVTFGSAGPVTISYGFSVSDSDVEYSYITNCGDNDCSGVTINTVTNEIAFTGVILFRNNEIDNNSATGSITLNGSVAYGSL